MGDGDNAELGAGEADEEGPRDVDRRGAETGARQGLVLRVWEQEFYHQGPVLHKERPGEVRNVTFNPILSCVGS
jgi:hypothetical protein